MALAFLLCPHQKIGFKFASSFFITPHMQIFPKTSTRLTHKFTHHPPFPFATSMLGIPPSIIQSKTIALQLVCLFIILLPFKSPSTIPYLQCLSRLLLSSPFSSQATPFLILNSNSSELFLISQYTGVSILFFLAIIISIFLFFF